MLLSSLLSVSKSSFYCSCIAQQTYSNLTGSSTKFVLPEKYLSLVLDNTAVTTTVGCLLKEYSKVKTSHSYIEKLLRVTWLLQKAAYLLAKLVL